MARRGTLLLALLCTTIACAAAPHAGPHRGSLDGSLPSGLRHLAAGTRCPPVSRDVLAARARDNTLMFAMVRLLHSAMYFAGILLPNTALQLDVHLPRAECGGASQLFPSLTVSLPCSLCPTLPLEQMNEAQWDFGRNWLHHVKKAGIGYYIAVAADVPTSEALVAAGEPCVERIDNEAAKLGGCCRAMGYWLLLGEADACRAHRQRGCRT